ncbi:MAG: hypothetical protein WD872_21935 [Pirellulaceae bacterium]
MSIAAPYSSESAILTDVILPDVPDLPREHAQWLLSLSFNDQQQHRILELADRGNRGELTEDEHQELDRFRRIGMMLNLAQAKARLSLQQANPDS